jgi:hypothetical protein
MRLLPIGAGSLDLLGRVKCMPAASQNRYLPVRWAMTPGRAVSARRLANSKLHLAGGPPLAAPIHSRQWPLPRASDFGGGVNELFRASVARLGPPVNPLSGTPFSPLNIMPSTPRFRAFERRRPWRLYAAELGI